MAHNKILQFFLQILWLVFTMNNLKWKMKYSSNSLCKSIGKVPFKVTSASETLLSFADVKRKVLELKN